MIVYFTADADAAAVSRAVRRWLREHGTAAVAPLLLQVGPTLTLTLTRTLTRTLTLTLCLTLTYP